MLFKKISKLLYQINKRAKEYRDARNILKRILFDAENNEEAFDEDDFDDADDFDDD